jgi:hypothetical protein
MKATSSLAAAPVLRKRKLRIIAQDPAVRVGGAILTAEVDVPAEELAPGPWGHRVHVIDYDASSDTLFEPPEYARGTNGEMRDPFRTASDETLLNDPRFHAQNVYAIVMRILARFERALGRRVSWSFSGHQLKVAPHAFADANAFYSKNDQALMFGYFPGANDETICSCLSHDVVAHETTHALVDGLRERYTDPSSPDQAAFHEGFSDVVALLSVFALPDVVAALLDIGDDRGKAKGRDRSRVAKANLEPESLRKSVLFGLAEQMGEELSRVRGQALRRSALLEPSASHLKAEEFQEPHRRGEILVAVMLNAFIEVWSDRLKALHQDERWLLDRGRVVEEGARAADYLLTMSIRALDYAPPVHLDFRDFICALLTADYEIRPDDSMYQFRRHLLQSFRAYGLRPTSGGSDVEPGIWLPPHEDLPGKPLDYSRTHFESMQRDPDEVFRFIWENRQALRLFEGAFSRVLSVRPCLRIGEDGFALRETVAEYIQMIDLEAHELRSLGVTAPRGMPRDTTVRLYGGGVLIFDEYGKLKFHIHNRIDNAERQTTRLQHLFAYGYFNSGSSRLRRFSHMHRMRALDAKRRVAEEWL